jgi:HK97 family phage major capsid protein
MPEASKPEGDGTSPEPDASAVSSESTATDNTQHVEAEKSAGDLKMGNEVQEQGNETPAGVAVDTDAIVSAVTMAFDERVTKSLKAFEERLKKIEEEPVNPAPMQVGTKSANLNTKTGLGDSWQKAAAHFVRTGDDGGLKAMKASNDTDMNVGTDADGGYAVPTGHYQGIIARRDEMMLADALGVLNIPGKGTTVNVPLDAEADGEFVSTAEAASTDRDAPALGQAAMTLVKYTKRVELSYELLEDEDSRLMAFLEDFIGRGMAKTHNSLLVTEILANGTSAKTTTGAAAITAGEIMDLEYALADEYTDNAAWLMRRASEGTIRQLQGNDFLFQVTPAGNGDGSARRDINGFPVYNSQSMPAIASTNKAIAFVNGNFIGKREAPDITFLRDPYSKASTGQIVLHYYFRTVYRVLQAEAVQYLTQAT